MAATCTAAGLSEAVGCYTPLTPTQRQALRILYLAQILQTLGGTSYLSTTDGLTTTLMQDACATTNLSPVAKDSAMTYILKDLTDNGTTLAAELTTIKCLVNTPQGKLDAAELYLWCLVENGLYPL